jgi:enediyne biosynthesis protein E4
VRSLFLREWSDRMARLRGGRVAAVIAATAVVVGAIGAAAWGSGALTTQGLAALGPPRFVEETASSGLRHVYDGGFEFAVGGGIAVFDCSGDGKPDLYIAGGANPAALFRNDSPAGGALRFVPIHGTATDLVRVNGAYPIDIDGDGITDLAVLRDGEDVLLRGLGGCRFARANETFGFRGGNSATTAFSATWEPGATLPTLAFGGYLDPASNDPHRLCYDNALVRPAPAGRTYASPLPLTPGWCALSMLFSDWSRSGRMDLRVSNDAHYYLPSDGQEQLWRMIPGAPPALYTADDGWVNVQVQGMGIASYDLTGDGYPEVFLTSQGDNRLQTLTTEASRPTYRDIGLRRGANAAQPFVGGDARPSTAWHAEFADVNDDGLIDLFIAKGNVTNEPDHAQRDPSNLLLGQADGTFRETADAAGILSYDRGRGAALADLNLDGKLDLIEVNYGAPVRIWRNAGNQGAAGAWLQLRLAQAAPNADAVGAWVEVRSQDRVQRREVTIGGGHAGGALGWFHFGLGSASGAEVRVTWPGGEVGPWVRVGANQFAVLRRGDVEAHAWLPSRS